MKQDREKLILQLIEKYPIETQEELLAKLRENGCNVTQATVSRDIKRMMLVKVNDSKGRNRYSAVKRHETTLSDKMLSVYSHAFVSAVSANNLVVVKALTGMGPAIGAAIDSLKLESIVGSIAGDDTLLLVCPDAGAADEVAELLRSINA